LHRPSSAIRLCWQTLARNADAPNFLFQLLNDGAPRGYPQVNSLSVRTANGTKGWRPPVPQKHRRPTPSASRKSEPSAQPDGSEAGCILPQVGKRSYPGNTNGPPRWRGRAVDGRSHMRRGRPALRRTSAGQERTANSPDLSNRLPEQSEPATPARIRMQLAHQKRVHPPQICTPLLLQV
jgi:hypothetical protein